MLAYVANIAADISDDIFIIVLNDVTNHSLEIKKKITIKIIKKADKSLNKIGRIIYTIEKIKEELKVLNPDILIPFVSGNVIFTYLAVRNKYYIVGAERGNPEALPLRLKILCKFIYPKCNYMLFQSKGAADFYFKRKKGKYEIIPNPCILPLNQNTTHNKGQKIKIVSSSRLAKEKNLDILLLAFQKCKARNRSELFLYGEGGEEQSLKQQVNALGLNGKVWFCGKVDNVSEQICDADIFVLVSSGEGMPNGLIEAMALGIPCITTNCMTNNTNSLVTDEVNGLIVKKRNVNELAFALDRLVYEKGLAERLSQNAIKIREDLSEQQIHKRILDFLNKILVDMEEA